MKYSKGVYIFRVDIEDITTMKLNFEHTARKYQRVWYHIQPYVSQLDYNFWKTDDILRAVLPED